MKRHFKVIYLKKWYYLVITFVICFNSACHTPSSNSSSFILLSHDQGVVDLSQISLPPGFSIHLFAKVPGARSLALGSGGTIFVGTRGDKVYAVRDEDNDGYADKLFIIANDLNTPNGVAFKNGNLFIATISTIYRLDKIEEHLSNPPHPIVVFDKYPKDKHHGWKFIAFGPDGKLYVPVGAPCNICEGQDSIYSSITRMNPDGSGMEIYAHGIRNTVGFDWHPGTQELWFTENGRDNMGDEIPNDELNKAPTKNLHFGFPYCHQGNTLDPEYGKGKNCSDYTAPLLLLGPHVAALGMRFYTGKMFPEEYRNSIFIAEHGSWNRSTPIGYRVSVANLDSMNSVRGYTQFAEGWLHSDGSITGRPVDILQLTDGSLLVSDDYNGCIYRISYNK